MADDVFEQPVDGVQRRNRPDPGAERRTELRAKVSQRLQISIPDTDGSPEICISRNASRHGLYFVTSSSLYTPGMRVSIIRNFDPDDQMNASENGEIVRVDSLSADKKGIAIKILASPEPGPQDASKTPKKLAD